MQTKHASGALFTILSGRASDCFVTAWEQCRKLVQEDHHVVDRICQLERQRVRGAAPKRMPQLAQAKSAPRDVVRRELVWKRKHAVTDSLTGSEQQRSSVTSHRQMVCHLSPDQQIWDDLWHNPTFAGRKLPRSIRSCPPPDPEYSPSPWVFSKTLNSCGRQSEHSDAGSPGLRLLILPSVSLARLRCTFLPSSILLPREALRRRGPCGTSAWALTSPSRMQRNMCLAGRNKMSCSRPAKVLEPGNLLGLLLLLQRAGGSARVALQAVLLPLISCLRWRHVQ